MPKCSNCGAEIEGNAKFCGECGTPVPQSKKCVKCGVELPLKMKFCFECGAPQNGTTPSSAGISMGDKNVVAGDIVGQKVAGDNVQSKIMGNAIYNVVHDDSKQIKKCHICGGMFPLTEGFICPECNEFTCSACYDTEWRMCRQCVSTQKQKNLERYKAALDEVLEDGVIDFNERNSLKKLQAQLRISDKDADALEQAAKSSKISAAAVLTRIEQINLQKAKKLYYDSLDIDQAYDILEPIYKAHPLDEQILDIYLPVLIQKNIESAKQVVQSAKVDCLALSLAGIEIAVRENRLDILELKVNQAKNVWPDSGMLQCFEAVFNIKLALASRDRNFIDEARKVAESFADSDNMVEKKFKSRIRELLNAVDDANDEDFWDVVEGYLQRSLYAIGAGLSEIVVGPDQKLKSIAQALLVIDVGGTIYVKPGVYNEHLYIDKKVSIIGEIGEDGNMPKICDQLENTPRCIHVNAPASLKNLIVTSKGEVDHSSLDFSNGQHYEAVYITADATLENVSICGWFDDGILIKGDGIMPVVESCQVYKNQGVGISVKGKSCGLVRNCHIFENGQNGIQVIELSAPKIEACKIHDNKTEGKGHPGIIAADNSKPSVMNCEIYGHLSYGIWELKQACGTYTDCKIHDNGDTGVYIQDQACGTYRNCEIFNNRGNGFEIDDESSPKIEDCKIHDNKSDGKSPGIVVKGSSKPLVTNCEIFGHPSHGIWEKKQACGTYTDCKIHDNDGTGVKIQDQACGTYRNCEIFNNKENGFLLEGESSPKVEGCNIHDNKTKGETYPGIVACENSKPSVMSCEIYGHLSYGIWEKEQACGTYINCKIYKNNDSGVYIQDQAGGTYGTCEIFNNKASGFVLKGNSSPKVEGCNIHDNKVEGKNYPGIIASENSKPSVANCEIYGHLSDGIWEKEQACGTYTDCKIHDNDEGVETTDSACGAYRNCEIFNNRGCGFVFSGNSSPKVEGCNIHDNKTEGKTYPGIIARENSKPTVMNCEVYDHLASGVWEKEQACGTYTDCKIHHNNSGVETIDSACGTYKNSDIFNNRGTGFNLKGDSSPKVEACKIYKNNDSGVYIQDQASGIYRNCEIFNNGANGFFFAGESSPKVEGCKIHDNKTEGELYPGIIASENSKPSVMSCEIYGHLSYGIWEKVQACGTYTDCKIHDNDGAGVYIQDQASGIYRNCEIFNNKKNGFFLKGDSSPKVEGCKIHDNKTEGELYLGIVACENSKPSVMNCEIYGHLSDGIWEKGQACGTYTDCKIHDNNEGVETRDSACGTYRNCHLHHNQGKGINIRGTAAPVIENCCIYENGTPSKELPGIYVYEKAKPSIKGCEIYGHRGDGICEKDQARGSYDHCNIHDNAGQQISKAKGFFSF